MSATESFFQWWFEAGGIGGWVFFFILDIIAVAWIIYDSQRRKIQATGWLLGALLPMILLLPSLIMGFSSSARADLQELQETFFYLGLIGGIIPIVVAIGYTITYQGVQPQEPLPPGPGGPVAVPPQGSEETTAPPPGPTPPAAPPPAPGPHKALANAWLVDDRATPHQLSQGDTRVGRNKANDMVFTDKSVSREHFLIREEGGHFTIYDRGSKTGTYVNGHRLEGPVLLAHDDVIEAGDTRLRFVTSRQ